MTKWQWNISFNGRNRLVYAAPDGKVIPANSLAAERLAERVIEDALAAQRPYLKTARPRSVLNEPGGLVRIETGERTIVVGDLHGRYDNLELVLRDKGNLQDILSGKAHLVFVGDAVHPRSVKEPSRDSHEGSISVMLLIMALKAANPYHVHYLLGNHDAAHAGGRPVHRRDVRLDDAFRRVIVQRFGNALYERYAEFLHNAPAAAKVKMGDGYVLVLHAGQSERILNEQGLVNIFVKGRKSLALQDVLWTRDYNEERLRAFLERVGARFIISGHTGPTEARKAVWAEHHGEQRGGARPRSAGNHHGAGGYVWLRGPRYDASPAEPRNAADRQGWTTCLPNPSTSRDWGEAGR